MRQSQESQRSRRLCRGPGIWFVLAIWVLVFGVRLMAVDQKNVPGPGANSSGSPPDEGEIQGSVFYRGTIPKSKLADDAGVRRDLVEVDQQTRGIRWVVVHLRPVNEQADLPKAPSLKNQPPDQPVAVDQQDYSFVPRVIAVRQNALVTFTNSDPANHNVRSSSAVREDQFNIFTGIGGKYEHRFQVQDQERPVRLGCDIHPWMQGWVYVFDHPCFAVTDRQGRFRILKVPAGVYTLVVRQPDLAYTHDQHIRVLPNSPTRMELEIPGR